MRLEEESAVVREAIPEAYLEVVAAVTELGSVTFLMVLLAVLYWWTRRRESALVVGYAVAGLAFLLVVRGLVGFDRPPTDLHVVPAADGDAFPSGHAFAATVIYGGLLVAFDRVRDRLAIAAVVFLVVLVSLSRIVLGVHYLGDVIAGVVVGIVFLASIHRVAAGDPRRPFVLGIAFALPAVVVTGANDYSLVALGGGLGGLLGWARLEAIPELRSRVEGAVLSVAGLAAIAVGGLLESTAAAASSTVVAGVGTVVVNAALFAAILLVPALVGALDFESIAPSDA